MKQGGRSGLGSGARPRAAAQAGPKNAVNQSPPRTKQATAAAMMLIQLISEKLSTVIVLSKPCWPVFGPAQLTVSGSSTIARSDWPVTGHAPDAGADHGRADRPRLLGWGPHHADGPALAVMYTEGCLTLLAW
ncbi:hypothetical protein [Cereibacter changlensis]|nr:hypothetical protein [Cereibacter changlensis]